jgi:hypothetical protein
VNSNYQEIDFKFGKVTAIAPQSDVLSVSFSDILEYYMNYDLSAGDLLNITALSWTGAKYYNQGIESMHAHAKDPLLRMDKNWEIL